MIRRRTGLAASVLLAVAAVNLGSPLRLAAEGRERSATSETLVEMAYAAEVAGQPAVRDALVGQVLSQDPDNERARWLAGQVHGVSGWGSAQSVEHAGSEDELLQEYVQRRETCGADVASRLKLANWCRDRGMPDREKVHLIELVSRYGVSDPAVMSRLGMVKFRGQWLPKQDLDEFRRLDDRQRRVEKKWKPIFAEWKDDLKSGGSGAYERLSERLREVADDEALPNLENVLSLHGERAALAVVGRLGELRSPGADESLVRHAVFSEFEAVRVVAAEALRERPKYNYVHMLLDGLVAPLEIVVELPHGSSNYVRRTVIQRGLYQDRKLVDHEMRYVIQVRLINRRGPAARALAPRLAASPGRYVHEGDAATQQRNQRIREVLYLVTGQSYGEPKEWWEWWNDYTENERGDEKPTIERHGYRQSWAVIPSSSCLAWGTQIATETGSRPIEQIVPGDRVLAQSPSTGQLEYKAVSRCTIQPLEAMREILFEYDSITVTLGHQFWVVGQGWCMAKELSVGQRVHCLEGSQEITGIEKRSDAAAYNLVVDNFATYFAGPNRALLHDFTFPQPTGALLPGYAPERRAD